MVTIRAASLTFSNSTFCPHSVFMCFVWIWEQTAIISLYSVNWLVFITEMLCLLRGTDRIFIYHFEVTWYSKIVPWLKRSVAGLSLQSSGFDPRAVQLRYVVKKWHWDRGFLHLNLFSPASTTPPILHTNLQLHVILTRRANGRSLESFEEAMLFRKSGSVGQITTFTCSRCTQLHYTCLEMTHICTQVTHTHKHNM